MEDHLRTFLFSLGWSKTEQQVGPSCILGLHRLIHSNLSYLNTVALVCIISSKLRVGINTPFISSDTRLTEGVVKPDVAQYHRLVSL